MATRSGDGRRIGAKLLLGDSVGFAVPLVVMRLVTSLFYHGEFSSSDGSPSVAIVVPHELDGVDEEEGF